ncbi:hypothetical protein FRX31_019952 [Thalictrum thalictroides]|uniref:Transmembrane protein n=1 Tax=Thalictrum thalictroides TaxID=46969 RepID=A0A7J6W000_THATH|nr:hypothetical protein FRX31_019952 [Thalictrum thalictroides]
MLDVKGLLLSGVFIKFNYLVAVLYWVNVIYIIFYKKKKKHSKSVSQPRINFQWFQLLKILTLFLSLLVRFVSRPPLLPFMIVSNFLSEIPMLLLFLVICTGWPSIKQPLQQKSNLVAVGVFFMELILVPYFVRVLFPEDINNSNQYFESFNLFKFVLLFQALKSSTAYLKRKGIGIGIGIDEASINVYNTKLFRSMVLYYPSYLAIRAILFAFFFNSFYSLYLNEILSLVFFMVMACRFIPQFLIDPDNLHLTGCKDIFSELLQNHPLLFKH